MEAFEQFAALAMGDEGLVVEGGLKFPVTKQTRKAAYPEFQTHGYEVDLVGAHRDRLVLASVKSFFGSSGVNAHHLDGTSSDGRSVKRYLMFNDPVVREQVVAQAAARFGYDPTQVQVRLYVGKFSPGHEQRVRDWCAGLVMGGGPVTVHGPGDVVPVVQRMAESTMYRDSSVLATLKVLAAVEGL